MKSTKIYKIENNGKVKISVHIPAKTLERLDNAAEDAKKTRSEWLTMIIMEKLAIDKFLE
jgi:metal-responsive CopG/Arc/MetJ family transcriptional regulator